MGQSYSLTKMAPCEFTTRSRFQVAFEIQRRFLFVELDDDEPSPWTMAGRMRREAFVVRLQSEIYIGRHAYIVLIGHRDALDDVDEAAGVGHGREHVQKPRPAAWHAGRELSRVLRGKDGRFRDFSERVKVKVLRSDGSGGQPPVLIASSAR
jgi:hypothetical protein